MVHSDSPRLNVESKNVHGLLQGSCSTINTVIYSSEYSLQAHVNLSLVLAREQWSVGGTAAANFKSFVWVFHVVFGFEFGMPVFYCSPSLLQFKGTV